MLPVSVAAAPAPPREGTFEVVDSHPVARTDATASRPPTPGPPPTLAPPPALVPPATPPPSAPSESQPNAPVAVGNAVIAATGGTAVNMRAGPSTAAPVITTLAEGSPVEALDAPVPAEGRSWQKIRSGDREGWVVAVVVQPR